MSQLTVTRGLHIRTNFDHPPIPDRNFDWSAWIDGDEERGIIGRGRTESDAVAELLQTLEERDEIAFDEDFPRDKSHTALGLSAAVITLAAAILVML